MNAAPWIPLAALGLALSLAGCQFNTPGDEGPPAAAESYIPPVDTDVDMEGYLFLLVAFEDPEDGGEYECQITEYMEGRRSDQIEDDTCDGCDRYYKLDAWLLPGTEGDPCGITEEAFPWMSTGGRNGRLGLVPIDEAASSFSWWGEAYGVSDLLYANWDPTGLAGGNNYSFFMYAYPSSEVLEGSQYREGEWVWYSIYTWTIASDLSESGSLYVAPVAYLGAFQ